MEETNIDIKTRIVTTKHKDSPHYEIRFKGEKINNVIAVVLMDIIQDGKKIV